jgi:hypothetical protein
MPSFFAQKIARTFYFITDARTGDFMWTNEHTIQFRALMNEFDAWKPALDVIHKSIELNPQWIAAVLLQGLGSYDPSATVQRDVY